MPQRLDVDLLIQQDLYCCNGFVSNRGHVSPSVIFEMNFLPGRVNKRCADKCGGFKNARYLKTELSVDWAVRRKTGLLSEINNKT